MQFSYKKLSAVLLREEMRRKGVGREKNGCTKWKETGAYDEQNKIRKTKTTMSQA